MKWQCGLMQHYTLMNMKEKKMESTGMPAVMASLPLLMVHI